MKSDTELAHRVRQTLEWDALVPDQQITSTVENGWVTLEGQVDVWNQREEAAHINVAVAGGTVTLSGRVQSWFEKRAILGAIRHAPGVEAVDDHLRIDPVR